MNERLSDLLKKAREVFERMTQEDRAEMLRKQSESYGRACVRGNMTEEEWRRWQ